jgi:hypothetical protein
LVLVRGGLVVGSLPVTQAAQEGFSG